MTLHCTHFISYKIPVYCSNGPLVSVRDSCCILRNWLSSSFFIRSLDFAWLIWNSWFSFSRYWLFGSLDLPDYFSFYFSTMPLVLHRNLAHHIHQSIGHFLMADALLNYMIFFWLAVLAYSSRAKLGHTFHCELMWIMMKGRRALYNIFLIGHSWKTIFPVLSCKDVKLKILCQCFVFHWILTIFWNIYCIIC